MGRDPGDVATPADTLGIIIGECIRRADSLEDRELLAAARRLDTTALYGRFRLDPDSLRQIGHEVLLVEWQDSRKRSGSTRRATRHALNPIEAFRCEEVADWRGGGAPARRAQ